MIAPMPTGLVVINDPTSPWRAQVGIPLDPHLPSGQVRVAVVGHGVTVDFDPDQLTTYSPKR